MQHFSFRSAKLDCKIVLYNKHFFFNFVSNIANLNPVFSFTYNFLENLLPVLKLLLQALSLQTEDSVWLKLVFIAKIWQHWLYYTITTEGKYYYF